MTNQNCIIIFFFEDGEADDRSSIININELPYQNEFGDGGYSCNSLRVTARRSTFPVNEICTMNFPFVDFQPKVIVQLLIQITIIFKNDSTYNQSLARPLRQFQFLLGANAKKHGRNDRWQCMRLKVRSCHTVIINSAVAAACRCKYAMSMLYSYSKQNLPINSMNPNDK
jgi:hypothetical protein